MASDYRAIRADNEKRYGTDIGRIGPMLLADRYDDRTHFIFELLQNAEDALARRKGWSGQRSVRFHLTEKDLRVSHFGKPFDEPDVRGICGIAESTKDLTAIGRFGIGFKSVYAFTDRPEVHSGAEDFAIESFVWPGATQPAQRHADETVIVIPLRVAADRDEIAVGLQRLGAGALLFLREIEEIEWEVEHGPSGLYLRSRPDKLGEEVRRITVVGQEHGQPDIEETWLVFSKPVLATDGKQAGNVEVAFSVEKDEKLDCERVRTISKSPLVAYFPTVVETHLGFLVQGPYRTTPSRDNVPHRDAWNQHCVTETASVLTASLRWLRDHDLLDAGTLRSLPLDRTKFAEGSMFGPIFDATKQALASEALLPRFAGGHSAAKGARLARTQELRELFDAMQVAALFKSDGELAWLSNDISQDRTPELRQYMMRELEIAEVTPEMILPKLDAPFLEAQADGWVLKLYEFLSGQPALLQRATTLPLVRLVGGKQVVAQLGGQPQAFLPGTIETGFPTVRAAVCASDTSKKFLRTLGLTEPDPVDDVVWNVLPKYQPDEVDVGDSDYENDIRRILKAFSTDSKGQREKLLAALRETSFVMAIDTGTAKEFVAKPGGVYLSTDRLKDLFAGVPDVLRVDDRYACLRGEDVRELLEACGAVRYLRPIEDTSLSWQEKQELRVQSGHAQTSGYNDRIADWTLLGLAAMLGLQAKLSDEERCTKAALLWEELAHLEERRGKGVFTGEYTWTHHGSYRAAFDAAFARLLNTTEWVPGPGGTLCRPDLVIFDSLGWKPNPFLLSKIEFKPPLVDQLAIEAGIEPGVLDLLKKLGVTSEAELRTRLGMKDDPAPDGDGTNDDVDDALKKLLGGAPDPTPPTPDPNGPEPPNPGGGGGNGHGGGHPKGGGHGGGKRTPGAKGGRPFISYVGTHPEDEDPDPDGLDQSIRMALEAKAIDLIVASEPKLQRTPAFNPGFDLFEVGVDGQPVRWVEVKAMTGGLRDRPVGLSHTQFVCAQERGSSYWLYVVEHAGADSARIVRMQDPAGKARTFTFDHGWLNIADVGGAEEKRED